MFREFVEALNRRSQEMYVTVHFNFLFAYFVDDLLIIFSIFLSHLFEPNMTTIQFSLRNQIVPT